MAWSYPLVCSAAFSMTERWRDQSTRWIAWLFPRTLPAQLDFAVLAGELLVAAAVGRAEPESAAGAAAFDVAAQRSPGLFVDGVGAGDNRIAAVVDGAVGHGRLYNWGSCLKTTFWKRRDAWRMC